MADSITIQELPRAQHIARELIAEQYPELASARVLWLVTSAKAKCKPKVLSPFERYLSSGEAQDPAAGYDLVCVVNETDWGMVCNTGRERALVDHLCAHVERVTDDEGTETWKVKGHDVEDFHQVVERHGAWHPRLRDFAHALQRQLPLPTAPVEPQGDLLYADVRREIGQTVLAGRGAE
jgi:hypothetical protein